MTRSTRELVRRCFAASGLGLLALALHACALGGSPAISRADLAQRIERGAAPLVLDVRSTSEYASGHVPGAVHIPFREVDTRHPELGAAKDEPIVVYCAHGPRAAWAARSLRNAGYTDVVYLEGHMSAWQEAGLPSERPAAAADASER
jgi:rhodanese-related sulfurtransferase